MNKENLINHQNDKIVKLYSNLEDLERCKKYYYILDKCGDVFPFVYETGSDYMIMEYIEHEKQALSFHQQVDAIIEITKQIVMPYSMDSKWSYDNRFHNVYLNISNSNSLEDELDAFLRKECEECLSFYRKYKQKTFLLHGDLHEGNILYDIKAKRLRVIDPIVTIAPIEFEFTRGLQNLVFPNYHMVTDMVDDFFYHIKDNFVELDRKKLHNAFYIDSVLRCMETIRDCPCESERINESLEFVVHLKSKNGGLKK